MTVLYQHFEEIDGFHVYGSKIHTDYNQTVVILQVVKGGESSDLAFYNKRLYGTRWWPNGDLLGLSNVSDNTASQMRAKAASSALVMWGEISR